jgi:hypothetical protein
VTCAELEELAAELALGTVSGAERAVALDHLSGCAACRRLVDELSRVADTMLLLAPVAEPPAGFESKVLGRMGVAVATGRRRMPRRRLLVSVAAVALVAALAGAGGALLDADRGSPEIRTALAVDDQGRWTCRLTVYGESPAWLVVSLDRTDGSNSSYSVEAVLAGRTDPVSVGTFTLRDGHGTLATTTDLPVEDVRSVRVVDGGGRVRYVVPLPA